MPRVAVRVTVLSRPNDYRHVQLAESSASRASGTVHYAGPTGSHQVNKSRRKRGRSATISHQHRRQFCSRSGFLGARGKVARTAARSKFTRTPVASSLLRRYRPRRPALSCALTGLFIAQPIGSLARNPVSLLHVRFRPRDALTQNTVKSATSCDRDHGRGAGLHVSRTSARRHLSSRNFDSSHTPKARATNDLSWLHAMYASYSDLHSSRVNASTGSDIRKVAPKSSLRTLSPL